MSKSRTIFGVKTSIVRRLVALLVATLLVGGSAAVVAASPAAADPCVTHHEAKKVRAGMKAKRVHGVLHQQPFMSEGGVSGPKHRKLWAEAYWGCGPREFIVYYRHDTPHKVARVHGHVAVAFRNFV